MSIFKFKSSGNLENATTDIIEVESDFNRAYDDLKNLLMEIEHDSIQLHLLMQNFLEQNKILIIQLSPRIFFSKPVKDIIPMITRRLDALADAGTKLRDVEKRYFKIEKEEWNKIKKKAETYLINTGQEFMEREWENLRLSLHKIAQCVQGENQMILTRYEPEVKRIMGEVQGAKSIELFLHSSKQMIERLQKEIEMLER